MRQARKVNESQMREAVESVREVGKHLIDVDDDEEVDEMREVGRVRSRKKEKGIETASS